MHEICALTAVN